MRIIGITGGIGSGKSTVSQILKEYGAMIIDADIIAREVVKKGQKALLEIIGCFGEEVLNENGELNRKKLAEIVFNNPQKLLVLNSITHKYIIEEIITQLKDAAKRNIDLVVIDAAIPFEHGFIDAADEIWVVTANEHIRMDRVMKRNNLDYDEAIARIRSQKTEEEYTKLSDKIIENNGSYEEMRQKVSDLLKGTY